MRKKNQISCPSWFNASVRIIENKLWDVFFLLQAKFHQEVNKIQKLSQKVKRQEKNKIVIKNEITQKKIKERIFKLRKQKANK